MGLVFGVRFFPAWGGDLDFVIGLDYDWEFKVGRQMLDKVVGVSSDKLLGWVFGCVKLEAVAFGVDCGVV